MIYLDEDTHLRLKYLALDQGVSMAELIRRAVAEYLKPSRAKARPQLRGGGTIFSRGNVLVDCLLLQGQELPRVGAYQRHHNAGSPGIHNQASAERAARAFINRELPTCAMGLS
jgi:hypothetical protein